ncbi:hypothetical protein HCH_00787 [Hahella chejuensis KCTC 2396]|uniref:Uncharacterized protein n=1 Tax=Hahella chejuensis (strain KCTC 2396) TaxID=349521 RepID=Q2SNU1_HAHCH|nr:hypothetical protein [Hahella chejuensis]ABC27683.1 hypothetical protein HCH_00787 [Hahella chejuensis KCTC 2396]
MSLTASLADQAEAHELQNQPELPPPSLEQLLTSGATISHCIHLCPLHVWMAQGSYRCKTQGVQASFWVYAEYRDRRGASRYASFRFASAQQALDFVRFRLTAMALPAISSEQSHRRPLG